MSDDQAQAWLAAAAHELREALLDMLLLFPLGAPLTDQQAAAIASARGALAKSEGQITCRSA